VTETVCVLGLGVMGAATAAALSRRGLHVIGLEQFGRGHELGSSLGQSRLIRQAYFEHPDYVPLLRRAYSLWRELEARSGLELLDLRGLLYIGHPRGPLLRGIDAAASQHGIQVQQPPAAEVRRRWPGFAVPEDCAVRFEPEAGYLFSDRAWAALLAEAQRGGAELRFDCRAESWRETDRGVAIETASGTVHAEHLVVTAGPWTARVLPPLGGRLRVTRQCLGWFEPPAPQRRFADDLPCWAAESLDAQYPSHVGLHYGMPRLRGAGPPDGLKVGFHREGPGVDPDRVDRTIRGEDEAAVRAGLQRYLPQLEGPRTASKVCLYTMSPDGHPLIDHWPGSRRVTVAAGFSGHGFKLATAVGDIVATALATSAWAPAASFLRYRW